MLLLVLEFDIFSYKIRTLQSDKDRSYIIKIPTKEVYKVRELVSDYMYPTLKYKL